MEARQHSGLGVASFVTSIVAGILIFLLLAIAGVMEASTPGGISEDSASAMVVGLLLFVFLGVALVALGLGVGGLMQKERKKIFAVLGSIFSAATLICTVSIIAVGMAME
jgi:hypothetical protein